LGPEVLEGEQRLLSFLGKRGLPRAIASMGKEERLQTLGLSIVKKKEAEG